jgi:polyisoprenoid-binding protein YceI
LRVVAFSEIGQRTTFEEAMATRTAPVIPTGTWTVDPAHSSVEFSVKHMGIANVRGKFSEFEATLEMKEDLAASRVRGSVKVASIDTGEAQRDDHLRSPDFFNVEEFPEIAFESTRIEALDEESSRVFGNLTMHGITHEIRLEVAIQGTDTDPWGNTRAGLEVVGKLKRSDWDMKFNQALGSGNMLVGDKVGVTLDISAVLQD